MWNEIQEVKYNYKLSIDIYNTYISLRYANSFISKVTQELQASE